MANRFFGETLVECDGQTYTLRCDFNAMCSYEEHTGRDALEEFQAIEEGGASVMQMRAIMFSFLQHHHPDATLHDAGLVLSCDMDALVRVVKASSPDVDPGKPVGKPRAAKVKKG